MSDPRSDERADEAATTSDPAGRTLREPVWPRLTRQTPDQRFFLQRLQRFTLMRRAYNRARRLDNAEQSLLGRAIYSAYRDCVALGVEADARSILRQTSAAGD